MPLLVITFRAPPPERPASAEYPLVTTWNSWTDSCAIRAPPPCRARPPRPKPKKALFASAPSMVNPEFTARWPLSESLPLASTWTVGIRSANRTKSRPEIGRLAISSSFTYPAAPARPTSSSGACATTTTVSATEARPSRRSTSKLCPTRRRMFSRRVVRKPASDATRSYSPLGTARRAKKPSRFVTAVRRWPRSRSTSSIATPGRLAPVSSLTKP